MIHVWVLAAAFSAFAVMQIQQSHFFTMDTFIVFFVILAIYLSVLAMDALERNGYKEPEEDIVDDETPAPEAAPQSVSFLSRMGRVLSQYVSAHHLVPLAFSVAFGVALGCAMASKVNALPVAMMLPAAFVARWLDFEPAQRQRFTVDALVYLVVAAAVSVVTFRVFQPYAFVGPSFFGFKINPAWMASMVEQRNQAAGDVDMPPALQWARRSITFSGKNLVLWGLGLPLGMLAWAGFLWAGWRMLKGDWQARSADGVGRHCILPGSR